MLNFVPPSFGTGAGLAWLFGVTAAAAFMLAWVLNRRAAQRRERVILLGGSAFAVKLCEEVLAARDRRFHIAGVVDDTPTAERMSGYAPWVGTVDQLASTVDRIRPARIVLTMADQRGRLPEQALLRARLRGVSVESGVDFYERVAGKMAIESLRPSGLILSGGFRRLDLSRGGFWWRSSRVVECVVSAVVLFLLAPVLGLVAALIKLDSPGTVFFMQPRVGCGGRAFSLVKFRTMRAGGGEKSEWVRDNVSRVTRVGKWLRRFRIDELPQLFNVLRGDMGFVGPRPHPMSNYELFLKKIPYYHLRELVRPGITGWAQVKYGYANSLEEETEKMRYDIYYIKHRSFLLDVRIVVDTALLLMFDRHSHEAAKSVADRWSVGPVAPLG